MGALMSFTRSHHVERLKIAEDPTQHDTCRIEFILGHAVNRGGHIIHKHGMNALNRLHPVGGQKGPDHPAVHRIRSALDEVFPDQPVQQACNHRLILGQGMGKMGLRGSVLPSEQDQNAQFFMRDGKTGLPAPVDDALAKGIHQMADEVPETILKSLGNGGIAHGAGR